MFGDLVFRGVTAGKRNEVRLSSDERGLEFDAFGGERFAENPFGENGWRGDADGDGLRIDVEGKGARESDVYGAIGIRGELGVAKSRRGTSGRSCGVIYEAHVAGLRRSCE